MNIRYGIIGAGNISKKFAAAVKMTTTSTVAFVGSRDVQKAKTFIEENDLQCEVGNYDELLASDNVDAVYIAVTNHAHVEWIKKAILAGKAVLCEKPMVVQHDKMLEVAQLAKENNVLLMEAMWTRFLPPILKAKEWIAQGKIGKLLSIDAEFAFKGGFTPENLARKKETESLPLYGVGVYPLEFAMDFADSKAKTIKSVAHVIDGVDYECTTVIRFEKHIIARISFGLLGQRPNKACLFGTEGMIEINERFYDAKKATLLNPKGEQLEVFINDVDNGFVYEVEHFSKLINEGKTESDRMPLSESIECARIFKEIEKQWAE